MLEGSPVSECVNNIKAISFLPGIPGGLQIHRAHNGIIRKNYLSKQRNSLDATDTHKWTHKNRIRWWQRQRILVLYCCRATRLVVPGTNFDHCKSFHLQHSCSPFSLAIKYQPMDNNRLWSFASDSGLLPMRYVIKFKSVSVWPTVWGPGKSLSIITYDFITLHWRVRFKLDFVLEIYVKWVKAKRRKDSWSKGRSNEHKVLSLNRQSEKLPVVSVVQF